MRYQTVHQWLSWQETLHPSAIDLGLDRPGEVMRRMGLSARPSHAVFTVAGTNGKGSTVAMLDSILRSAGYRVGAYTSPHLIRYNERICLNGIEISDELLCSAFERVDQARGDISLTYFEFGTLAAFEIFARADLDAVVLEVGMGGRLDAVNLVDADVAIVTPIDLDHTEWLGSDRDAIAREKAGIFRAGRPAVCSDPNPPATLLAEAARLGIPLFRVNQEFRFGLEGDGFWWMGRKQRRDALPLPALRGVSQPQNAAGVLMGLELMTARLPVYQNDVRAGLLGVSLPGRFQVVPGEITRIFDVGHNPQAAVELARNLKSLPVAGRTLAVCAMLGDKDVSGVASALRDEIAIWYVAGLSGARGRAAEHMEAALRLAGIEAVVAHDTVPDAYRAALKEAKPGDRVVVFGSFHTVAEAFQAPV